MNFKDKNVLVVGLANTGIAVVKKLHSLGANIIVSDSKNKKQLKDKISLLEDLEGITFLLGKNPSDSDLKNLEIAITSPGVPLDLPFFETLRLNNVPIIGEIELAFILSKDSTFVGITGTNGKTTTTSLVGAILTNANIDTHIVGNIGNPAINVIDIATKDSVLTTELSSFKLDSIDTFKPKISCILNLSEDHLDRYGNMTNYIKSKANIFKNQNYHDFCVLNYDDLEVRALKEICPATTVFFSRKVILNRGVFLEKDHIIIKENPHDTIELIHKDELSLPGDHNLENVLAAVAITFLLETPIDTIRDTLRTFSSIEHRLEYVDTINEVDFFNDSKGTNPDSTIKALNSFSKPIILIAGGKDKNNNFTEFIETVKSSTVKSIVLIGETAHIIKQAALDLNFDNIYMTDSMENAIEYSISLASPGDIILLSPACSSKDMYDSFEHRGTVFKDYIKRKSKK